MRKLVISFVAVLALVLLLTGVALADHYVYKAEIASSSLVGSTKLDKIKNFCPHVQA